MRRPTAAVLAALLTLSLSAGSAFAASAASAAGEARFRSADVIDGPDVASYQHPYGAKINWRAVARTHKDFAIVKATEGTSYRNPWFHRDYRDSRRAGLVRGSYHFARPAYPIERTARHQARFFAAHLGDTRVRDTLPPALDLESTGGLGRGALVTWAQIFLLELRKQTGRTPLIYTYPSFWTGALADPGALARYPLWMASYSGPADSTATLWQYTAGAHVDGIRGHVDMSIFTEPIEVWDLLRDGRESSPWPAETPGSPVHVNAHGGDASASVTWLPGDTGSTAVRHYTVTATALDGTPGASTIVSGTTTSATVRGLTNGTPYTFTVTAANTHGDGEPSIETNPVTPRVPTAFVPGGAPTTVYGANARVAMRLIRPDRSHGVPGRDVTVEQRVHDGIDVQWEPLRVATTDAHGWAVLHLQQPQHNVDLRFTYDGPDSWRDAQRMTRVLVRNDASAKLSRHHVRHGHAVTLRGHVQPVMAGVRVTRQAFFGHRWHSVGSTTTGPHGGYEFRFVPPSKGVHVYRTVVAGFDGRSHGYSPSRRLNVR